MEEDVNEANLPYFSPNLKPGNESERHIPWLDGNGLKTSSESEVGSKMELDVGENLDKNERRSPVVRYCN